MKSDFDEGRRLEALAPIYFSPTLRGVNEKYDRFTMQQILPLCKGPDVLELGCGYGLWTEALLQISDKIIVVDASKTLIKNIQDRFGNKVTCHNCLFEHFETEERFDTIVAAHILEHSADPVALLKRSSGWLKRDGKLIIVVPNAGSLHRRIGVLMGLLKNIDELSESDKLIGHRRAYTLTKLADDITESGLTVVEIDSIALKPLSFTQMEEWPDELLNAFFEIGRDLPVEWRNRLYAVAVLPQGGKKDSLNLKI